MERQSFKIKNVLSSKIEIFLNNSNRPFPNGVVIPQPNNVRQGICLCFLVAIVFLLSKVRLELFGFFFFQEKK